MSEGTAHFDQLRSRMERYGACMAAIRSYFDEIFFLQRNQLLPLLLSINDRSADMQSTIRVVCVIRYIYLNVRMSLEQIAFGMALANADITDRRIEGWHPGRVVSALRHAKLTPFYPRPKNSQVEYLHEEQFVPTYGKTNAILHTGNPLRMQSRKQIDPQVTASAVDAEKALQEAREMMTMLGEIRNLLAEHEVPTSFKGCPPWQVRMCDQKGGVFISTLFNANIVDCSQPTVAYDKTITDFWRNGRWP